MSSNDNVSQKKKKHLNVELIKKEKKHKQLLDFFRTHGLEINFLLIRNFVVVL